MPGGNPAHRLSRGCLVDNQYRLHPQQRKALHKWCEMVADTLNYQGMDMRKTLRNDIEIAWTKDNVKEYIYKPVLEALTGKESTEEQSTLDPTEIVDILVKHFGEKFGVELPQWPSHAKD